MIKHITVVRDWKQLATGIPVLGLLLILLVGSRLQILQRRAAEATAGDHGSGAAAAQVAAGTPVDRLDANLPAYTAMPAYADIQAALQELTAIRARVAAPVEPPCSEQEGPLAPEAKEYAEACQAVQAGIERLRKRVPPEAFANLLLGLADRFDPERLDAWYDAALAGGVGLP